MKHLCRAWGVRWVLGIAARVAAVAVGQEVMAETPSAIAPDSMFMQVAFDRDTQSLAAGVSWSFSRTWKLGAGEIRPYVEVMVSQWRYDAATPSDKNHLTQLAMTPVLRWRGSGGASAWFVEGGVGLSVTSSLYHSVNKQFSTSFNFGSHLGIGRNFGPMLKHELVLRIEHFSNGGIKHPNPGQNFAQLRYAYAFDQ